MKKAPTRTVHLILVFLLFSFAKGQDFDSKNFKKHYWQAEVLNGQVKSIEVHSFDDSGQKGWLLESLEDYKLEFDKKGNVANNITLDKNGNQKMRMTIERNDNNKIVRRDHYSSNDTKTGYDEFILDKDGNSVEWRLGIVDGKGPFTRFELTYDANRCVTKMIEYAGARVMETTINCDGNGNPIEFTLNGFTYKYRTYDSNGNITEEIQYISQDKLNQKFQYDYDEDNDLVKQISTFPDGGSNEDVFTYDQHKYPVLGQYSSSGKGVTYTESFDYTYDDQNNWTECKVTRDYKLIPRQKKYTIKRTIEYY